MAINFSDELSIPSIGAVGSELLKYSACLKLTEACLPPYQPQLNAMSHILEMIHLGPSLKLSSPTGWAELHK